MLDESLAISLNVHTEQGCRHTCMVAKHAEKIGLTPHIITYGDRQIAYLNPDTQENWDRLEQSLCAFYHAQILKNGGGSWAWVVFNTPSNKQQFMTECAI